MGIVYLLCVMGWPTFSDQSKIDNILGYVGHMVSMTASQLCCCGTDSTLKERGCVPIKLYLQRHTVCGIWPGDGSLPAPALCPS